MQKYAEYIKEIEIDSLWSGKNTSAGSCTDRSTS